MSIVGIVAQRFVNLGKPPAFRAASSATSPWGLRRIAKGTTDHNEAIAANLAERILTKRISLTRLFGFDVKLAATAINQAHKKQPHTLIVFLRDLIVDLITESAVSYHPKVIENDGETRDEIVYINWYQIDDLSCLLGQIEPVIKSDVLADVGNRLKSWAAQWRITEVDHRAAFPLRGASPLLQAKIAGIIKSLQ